MEGDHDVNLDSDDSDGLPDLFPNSPQGTNGKFEISPGDIVWAEFRNLHWPALVRKHIKKEGKYVVWYLDSPRHCFKLSRKQILSFKDPEIGQQIRKKASESDMKALHEKVLSKTLTFIRRRFQGYNDDPGDFFDSDIPYLSLKNLPTNSTDDNNPITFDEPAELNQDKDSSEENSDDDSVMDFDNDESHLSKYFSEIVDEVDNNRYTAEKIDAIVSYIVSGRIDKHLLAVQRGRIPSEFKQFYDDSQQTGRKKLSYNERAIELCGYINHGEKLREITSYLMNLYEKAVKGGKGLVYRYVISVWLPEAIDRAIDILREEQGAKSSPPKTSCALPSTSNKQTNISDIINDDIKPNKNLLPKNAIEETNTKRKKFKANKPNVQGTRSSPRTKLT